MRRLVTHLPEIAGLALLIGAALFWAATGRESLMVMMSALTLIALGAVRHPAGPPRSRP